MHTAALQRHQHSHYILIVNPFILALSPAVIQVLLMLIFSLFFITLIFWLLVFDYAMRLGSLEVVNGIYTPGHWNVSHLALELGCRKRNNDCVVDVCYLADSEYVLLLFFRLFFSHSLFFSSHTHRSCCARAKHWSFFRQHSLNFTHALPFATRRHNLNFLPKSTILPTQNKMGALRCSDICVCHFMCLLVVRYWKLSPEV
jgi:hypothetical protein